jgi:hypothetical protein
LVMDRTFAALPADPPQLIPLRSISAVWGIHLTGVGDLPPRAARRRSLQAGWMAAMPRRFGGNRLWAMAHYNVFVTNGSMRDGKLQDPVEQHSSAT